MDNERKETCLRMAEVIDCYRVFPRIFLFLFFMGYCWLMIQSWQWYEALPLDKIEWMHLTALTAFPLGLLTGLGGMFTSMYKHYQSSGRDWNERSKGEL